MKEKLLKIKNWISNNKVKSILMILLVVSLSFGLTAAAFYKSNSGELNTLSMGNLEIEYIDGETVNASNGLPLQESEVDEFASRTSFIVKNSGNMTGYADISLIINSLPDELNNDDFRWTLYREGEAISTGSFKDVGESLVLKKDEVINPDSVGINYSIAIWIRDNGKNQNSMENKTLNARINVKASDKIGEYAEYGVNPPELVDSLIPVEYNEMSEEWVIANTRKEWYSYSEQKWANALTVNKDAVNLYKKAEPGTVVSSSHIISMWVWIPRYKYKITNNIGSDSAVTTPPMIDVVFETGLSSTGVDEVTYRTGITEEGTNDNYYTHPAFRNGNKVYNNTPYDIGGWDEELTGIWVGKFETGNNATNPRIKAGIGSIRSQTVSEQFKTSLVFAGGTLNDETGEVTFVGNDTYGFTSRVDTHMMKNTEWGAVAILSQSQYGKMGNNNYSGAEKEVYINNSCGRYTGRSGGGPSGTPSIIETYPDQTEDALSNAYGFYSYNDHKLNISDGSLGDKFAGKGVGASTTGNIYGVYDMSGGSREYVFALPNKNFGDAGFNVLPNTKYFDNYLVYSYSNITKEKAILGDALWETKNWYSDRTGYSISTDYPFYMRGGLCNEANAGVFHMQVIKGTSGSNITFRTVLIP